MCPNSATLLGNLLVKQYQVARMKKKKKRKEKRSCLKDEVLNKDKGDGQVY